MEDYPSNSHKKADSKKVEKVVEGAVVRRKKPLSKRFTETFVGGDAKSVAGYVMFDVLIPAAKDMVADAMSQGVERMLFGEARSVSRRTGQRPGGSGGYQAYNRIHSSSPIRREDPRMAPQMSRRARAQHDFDEIVLATRVEAETVLDGLYNCLSQYDVVTVNDLYDLVGISGSYTDDKWGWTDLSGSGVHRVREGYLLNVPRPAPID